MSLIWQSIKFIAVDLVANVLYFPLWWYGEGMWKILRGIGHEIKEFAWSLNLGILWRYLFQPMYGLRDIWSRLISFYVRIVYFIVILFLTVIWLLVLLVLFFLWLLLPFFVIYNILWQLDLISLNLYEIFRLS